ITPKFDTLFPDMAKVNYFAQVLDRMFVEQTLVSNGQSLFVQGPPAGTIPQNWGLRLSGDMLIGLPAALACASSAGAGCCLAGLAAIAGVDFWQMLNPGVVNPDGSTTADALIRAWVLGICGGISDLWELATGIRPQIGCYSR